jgi:hypothetical protein
MRTIAEIDADIARVKAELKDVHGTNTEVYARIVGYYRSVKNWNPGKREEYDKRQLFSIDGEKVRDHIPEQGCGTESLSNPAQEMLSAGGLADRYELYTRKTCPNCPPVKECCSNLPLSGEFVDVDSSEGIARASGCGVVSAPTAIFYDARGAELGRAHTVKDIRALTCLIHASEAMPALN